MPRKAIIGILALPVVAVLFVAMSWIDGALVRARMARLDRSMTTTVPLFRVTHRKETPGVFSSTVEVSYEFNDRIFKGVAAATTKQTAYIVNAAPAPALTTPGFTVRHHIQHGPVPGFAALGLARVDTEFVIPEDAKQELRKNIGTDQPLKIITLLGYFGGGATSIDSPAFRFHDQRSGANIDWHGIKGRLNFSRGLNRQDGNVTLPGMEVKDDKGGHVAMGPMSFDYGLKRAFTNLYTGKASFRLENLTVAVPQQTAARNMEMRGLAYEVVTTANGDYLDTVARLGVDSMSVAAINSMGVHYDFSLRHMHGPTYDALTGKLREIYASALDGGTMAPQQIMAQLKEFGAQLLEHQPELTIERISMSMPEGAAQVSGKVSIPGYAHGDLDSGPMVLLPKLEASVDVSVDEGFLDRDWGPASPPAAEPALAPPGGKRPTGRGAAMNPPPPSRAETMKLQLAAMEQQGFVTRHGTQLTSHIEFRHGALTVNGKPMGPPGAGR